jgi:hypothetical protein
MITPMFAAIAGLLLVALWPTAEERRQWRKHRARHLLAYYRAPWSRALQPGGALVDPFTIGREPMEGRCSLSDTATAHEGDARR